MENFPFEKTRHISSKYEEEEEEELFQIIAWGVVVKMGEEINYH